MRSTISVIGLLALTAVPVLAAVPARAAVKGTFIGPGTYATADGCEKLKALAAGADKNVGTVPETLTEDGFSSWEGTCTFTSFTEKDQGRMWSAAMNCAEGANEGPESDIFERMLDGSIKVTVMNSATTLVRCDADKGK